MNKVIAAFKRIRLGQIFVVFLAGVLLIVSTACSSVQAKAPAAKNPRPEVPGGTATSPNSDVINTYEGGMNDFSDLDPRATETARSAADKAAALKENAERNVIDQTSDVGENTKRILDKKGENAADLGKNVQRSAEETKNKAQSAADDVAKSTKQAAQDVKDTTVGATRDLTNSASRAADNVNAKAKGTADSVSKGINRTADNVKGTAKDLSRSADRAADNVKANAKDTAYDLNRSASRAADNVKADARDTGNSLVDRAQQAIENAGDFVQGKLNQTGEAAERTADTTAKNTLNKVGNAINDTLE